MNEVMLHVMIPFTGNVEQDLSMRYVLAETLEERGIGQVVEEGTGEGGMHVVVQIVSDQKEKGQQVRLLTRSLGLEKVVIRIIEN